MWHEITLVGNLGRDPEMRYLPSGAAVTSFSVAVNKSYTKASGEKVKETIWVRVSAFGKLAEVVNQYCKKGQAVLVVGELQADKSTGGPRIWSAQDGSPRASFEVTAGTVRFLSQSEQKQDNVDEEYPQQDDPF
jgi:single-strand DNA-binding protein